MRPPLLLLGALCATVVLALSLPPATARLLTSSSSSLLVVAAADGPTTATTTTAVIDFDDLKHDAGSTRPGRDYLDAAADYAQATIIPAAAEYRGLLWGSVGQPGRDAWMALSPDLPVNRYRGLVAGTTSAPNAAVSMLPAGQSFFRAAAAGRTFGVAALSLSAVQAPSATVTLEGWRSGARVAVADVAVTSSAATLTSRPAGFTGLDEVRLQVRGTADCGEDYAHDSYGHYYCAVNFALDGLVIEWDGPGAVVVSGHVADA